MSVYLTRQSLDPATFAAPGGRRDPAAAGLIRPWMVRAFGRWQRRRVIQALQNLDDRLLADIGMRRADIPRVVREYDAGNFEVAQYAGPGNSDMARPR